MIMITIFFYLRNKKKHECNDSKEHKIWNKSVEKMCNLRLKVSFSPPLNFRHLKHNTSSRGILAKVKGFVAALLPTL